MEFKENDKLNHKFTYGNIYRQGRNNPMIPGMTLIMKAPGCRKPVKFSTILSGNTFGAVYWTDGKMEASMMPDSPWLRKSPSENVLFWSDECEQIGVINYDLPDDPESEKWKDAEYAQEPSESDYFSAIENDRIADTDEKRRYVRMRIWWKGNDHMRNKEAESLSEEQIQNLSKLVDLLYEDEPVQRILKAEALRELSRFEEAVKILEGEFPDEYSHAVKRILVLAKDGNSTVAISNDQECPDTTEDDSSDGSVDDENASDAAPSIAKCYLCDECIEVDDDPESFMICPECGEEVEKCDLLAASPEEIEIFKGKPIQNLAK